MLSRGVRCVRKMSVKLKCSQLSGFSCRRSSTSAETDVTERFDITGCRVIATSRTSLTAIDDNIMRIVTMNDKQHDYNSISDAIRIDPNCGMLHVLALYDHLRLPKNIEDRHDLIVKSINTMIKLHKQGVLTLREQHYLSAWVHWCRGDYFKASLSFESISSLYPNDTLAMKLAQESYLANGSNYNSLTCVTRYMALISGNHPIRRNLLSILSHGFVEANMYVDASETALRCIEMTSHHDLNAISAQLDSLLLNCKGPDASGEIDLYKETHYKTPIGAAFFGYYNSYAFSLRGNNSAAIREIGVCIDSLEARWLQKEPVHLSLLANITMMLWHVNLNIKENNVAVYMMWNRIASLWCESNTASSSVSKSIPHIQYRTPFEEICCSIAYTLAATVEGGIPASDYLPLHLMEYENLNSGSTDSENYHKKINSSYVVDNREYVAPTEDASAAESVKRSMWDLFSFNSNSAGDKSSSNTDTVGDIDTDSVNDSEMNEPISLKDLTHEELTSLLLQQEINMKSSMKSDEIVFGNIDVFLKAPSLSFANPRGIKGTESGSDKQQMMQDLGIPLCAAIKCMCSGEYKDAALILLQIQGLFGSCFGSSVLHSNILETTLIEALLRGGMWDEAQAMLMHRTTIYPNEAQSWRRTALLMHQLGHEELAESARYTAYELGVGQGGYGGSQA